MSSSFIAKNIAMAADKFALKQKRFTQLKFQKDRAEVLYAPEPNGISEENSEEVEPAGAAEFDGDGSVFDHLSPKRARDKAKAENPVADGTAPIRVSKEVHGAAASK